MSFLRFIMKKDKVKVRFFCKVAPLVLEVVMAENIDAKIAGNPGLEKAGYVRAAAAKIIRAAKPEKMSFKAQLMRIDCRNVVLKIEL